MTVKIEEYATTRYKLIEIKDTMRKLVMIASLSVTCVLIASTALVGCSSKSREGMVEFGLQSCFSLKSGETAVPADKYVEKFYQEYCEIHGASLAINRVIRKSGNDYTLICMATDKKLAEIPASIAADTTIQQVKFSQGDIEIAKKKNKYHTAIGLKNGYWVYYFMYFNEQIGHPFVIIFGSKSKEYSERYFSSTTLIQERLNCETH